MVHYKSGDILESQIKDRYDEYNLITDSEAEELLSSGHEFNISLALFSIFLGSLIGQATTAEGKVQSLLIIITVVLAGPVVYFFLKQRGKLEKLTKKKKQEN